MDESSEPTLTPEVKEDILRAQYEVDNESLPKLNALRVPVGKQLAAVAGAEATVPPQPIRLSRLLREYACALFEAEAREYPPEPELKQWLQLLGAKIEGRLLNTLRPGRLGLFSAWIGELTYHLAEADITNVIREALRAQIDSHLRSLGMALDGPSKTLIGAPKAQPETDVPIDQKQDGQPQSVSSETERRKRLLADYKAATNNPSNRKIYGSEHSGVHKPQFYEWINGVLSSDSATAKNFERFLMAKKSPIPRKPRI
jgi:hypothetical protein